MGSDESSNEPNVVLSERYDPDSDETVSLVIVQLVAIVSNREPDELEPLARSIDTDALDRLVDSTLNDDERSARVTFEYEDYEVEISADGTVNVLEDG